MECDICYREYDGKRLPFLCTVDARNQIYEPRYKHLQVILENDALQSEINSLLDNSNQLGQDAVELARASQRRAEATTSHILAAADRLRNDIKAAREEIQARKASISRRRSDLATLSEGLPERRSKQEYEVDKTTQRLRYQWAQSAEDMASCRSFLCAEAADLYGLERVTAKGGDGGSWEYHIGKVPALDLRDMNCMSLSYRFPFPNHIFPPSTYETSSWLTKPPSALSPEVITTSLGHIAHVLMLASHYFAIRLPAEVTLPHRDYPFPTIFNIASSYRHPPVPFPGISSTTTPVAPATEPNPKRLPRPRPLYIHRPLTQLFRDDPATYSYFIEGVALLAHDIAWLCSTQGLTFSEKGSFDEICQLGRNLYNLLIGSQRESDTNSTPNGKGEHANDLNWIGRFSHGTAFYNLGAAEGADAIKSFRLPSTSRFADRLRKKLAGDAPLPDWEVLEDDAWKTEDAAIEDITESKLTVAEMTNGSDRWTKVRS